MENKILLSLLFVGSIYSHDQMNLSSENEKALNALFEDAVSKEKPDYLDDLDYDTLEDVENREDDDVPVYLGRASVSSEEVSQFMVDFSQKQLTEKELKDIKFLCKKYPLLVFIQNEVRNAIYYNLKLDPLKLFLPILAPSVMFGGMCCFSGDLNILIENWKKIVEVMKAKLIVAIKENAS